MRPLSNATCTQSLWLRQKGKACRCPAPKRRSNRCLMRPACHLFGLASGLPACLMLRLLNQRDDSNRCLMRPHMPSLWVCVVTSMPASTRASATSACSMSPISCSASCSFHHTCGRTPTKEMMPCRNRLLTRNLFGCAVNCHNKEMTQPLSTLPHTPSSLRSREGDSPRSPAARPKRCCQPLSDPPSMPSLRLRCPTMPLITHPKRCCNMHLISLVAL